MVKHSDWNASWAQCPSNGVNIQHGGYLGEKWGEIKEIREIICNLLNDDEKYSGWGNINSNA